MTEKSSTVIRTTISVPQDLKKQMEAISEPVNWSGVACDAFRVKLAEISRKKENHEMSDVIERLRASKRESQGAEYQHGSSCGQDWARNWAEAVELERLERLHDERSDGRRSCNWNDFFDSTVGTFRYSTAERLYFDIHPEVEEDWEQAREFWEVAVGHDGEAKALLESDDFLRGFAEGALDVWLAVKDQL